MISLLSPPFYFSPVKGSFLVPAGGSKAAEVHRPCHIQERTAFPWVMCMTTAIGQGIKLSLLQQKLSIPYLSHKKKKKSLIWSLFLEACRIPPCLLHPSCIRQVPKSITLTTLCITVIAWVRLTIFVTITKADFHRLAWSSLFETIISEGYLL